MENIMATLGKFGVPLDGEKLGILHPKLKYRFRAVFQNFGDSTGLRNLTANAVTCTRPKVSHAEAELHAYNSVAWIAGKHTFEPIEIKLRDDITNSVASAVGSQVQKQMNHFEQTSAVAGINYKFSMEIHSLDGTDNEELESWVLEGCWLKDVAYDEGDYASTSDPQMITLTVRFDNATNVSGRNTNNGTTVGGNPYPNVASPTGGTTFA